MNYETFKNIHKVTIMDIKRNIILKGTLFLSFAVYFCMMILGDGTTEKKRWIAYAVFLYITTLSAPLIYYIRYSDKNKRIITCVVKTKLSNVKLYDYLLGFYHVVIFTVGYGVLTLLTELKYPGNGGLNIRLGFSVIFVLCITNRLCLLCFKIFKTYYIGVIVYAAVSIFCFTSSSVLVGFFFPMDYEILGLRYFVGKLMELFFIEVFLLWKGK